MAVNDKAGNPERVEDPSRPRQRRHGLSYLCEKIQVPLFSSLSEVLPTFFSPWRLRPMTSDWHGEGECSRYVRGIVIGGTSRSAVDSDGRKWALARLLRVGIVSRTSQSILDEDTLVPRKRFLAR